MLLETWISDNNLSVEFLTDNVLEVKDFAHFLYIKEKKYKIIDKDYNFILDDDEFEILENSLVKYILFEFGERYYYSPLIKAKDKYNNNVYKPKFLDFKDIGFSDEEAILKFPHLGVHSEYEILNGSGLVEDWAKKAKFLKVDCLGIIDKNTLGGVLAFQQACSKYKIKSLIGETVSVAYNYDKDKPIQTTFDVIVYAKNYRGWRNLLRINKALNVDYNNFIPGDEFFKYSENLVCVLGEESILFDEIKSENHQKVEKIIAQHKKYFKENLYFQFDSVEWNDDRADINHLKFLKYYCDYLALHLEPILVNESYYIDKEQYELKKYLNNVDKKVRPSSNNQYFKSINKIFEDFNSFFSDENLLIDILQLAAGNAQKVSEECNFKIETGVHKIPKFEGDKDSEELFFDLIQEGVEKKLGNVENIDVYLKRIETECELLLEAGFIDYFLILWDIVKWAKDDDQMVGTGRGSVGGSLVAYLLDIITIDPIKFDLLFERFLNRSRFMPDMFYDLELEDGTIKRIKHGQKVPLIGGGEIEIDIDTDLSSIDIDTDKLK